MGRQDFQGLTPQFSRKHFDETRQTVLAEKSHSLVSLEAVPKGGNMRDFCLIYLMAHCNVRPIFCAGLLSKTTGFAPPPSPSSSAPQTPLGSITASNMSKCATTTEISSINSSAFIVATTIAISSISSRMVLARSISSCVANSSCSSHNVSLHGNGSA